MHLLNCIFSIYNKMRGGWLDSLVLMLNIHRVDNLIKANDPYSKF